MATQKDNSSTAMAMLGADSALLDFEPVNGPKTTLQSIRPAPHLTFDALRGANLARMPQFRNSLGLPVHSKPDGSDSVPAQWLQALVGEIGEYANLRKKFERGDMPEETFRALAAKELADVQDYLDILAMQIGIDLGQATMDKFNEVSVRIGSTVRLLAHGWYYTDRRSTS
jgi:NTP pyrophosphatase (non-canonical NTP hydrolase)